MAGEEALAIVAFQEFENASSIKGHWQVHFSRFFVLRAPLHSAFPVLVPSYHRNRRPSGTWLASDSTASLQLHDFGSSTETILTVCLNEMILEEHFISKLHFTWPQVFCMSGFPARGSKAVLVSYRDCDEQIQKFALQFLTNHEAEEFMNSLKESLCDPSCLSPTKVEIPHSDVALAICSPSGIVSSNITPYRCPEAPDTITSKVTSKIQTTSKVTPKIPKIMDLEAQQYSYPKQTHEDVNALAAFPPSFTSLLTSCYPVVEQSMTPPPMAQPTAPQEADDLRSQILMYMEDSTFLEMLFKVDQVIAETTEDIAQPTASQEADDLRRQILMYMEDPTFQELLFKVDQVIAELRALGSWPYF